MMQSNSQATIGARVFRGLVANRQLIYIGGMIVISLPLLLATELGVEFSQMARLAVVVPTLLVMSVVYLGEQRIDKSTDGAEDAPAYSLGSRLSIAAAVVGFAVGVYVSLEGNPRAGSVYLFGSMLYGYREYRKQSIKERGEQRSRR